MEESKFFVELREAIRTFERTWMPISEVALRLGVSLSTAHKLGATQVFMASNLGCGYFALRSSVEALLLQPKVVAQLSKRGRKSKAQKVEERARRESIKTLEEERLALTSKE